jgi:hypothetical protein
MSIKLTDTQLVMLSAAAQRDDRCLVPSKNLKGGAAQKVTAKLVAAGFAKEIKAKTGAPVWRRDEQTGQGYALKLTAAGAKVIAIDEVEGASVGAGAGAAEVAEEGGLRESMIAIESSTLPRTLPETLTAGAAQILSAPRDGTKLAQVVEMLKDGQGATLAELVASTGWLPHTTRAALTGLRKRGYLVALDRSDKERGSTYFIRVDRMIAAEKDAARADNPRSEPVEQPEKGKRPALSRTRRAA